MTNSNGLLNWGIIKKRSGRFHAESHDFTTVCVGKNFADCKDALFLETFRQNPNKAFNITYKKSGTKWYFYIHKKGK